MNPEKNTSDIDHLKHVLAKSFDGGEGEDVPPMPDGLRDRIADQYGRSTRPPEAVSGERFLAMIGRLLRKPAFAAVTAAVIMLVVATAILNRPDRIAGFRGGGPGSAPAVTVVLHQVDAPAREAIENAGLDSGALTETRNPDELASALAAKGAHIVIDGASGRILGYRPGETDPAVEEALPGDPAALAAKIATFQTELTK